MTMKRLFFITLIITSVGVGCEQQSLEEEVDDICGCIQEAESEAQFERCYEKMEEISDKYAFDPEAAEEVKKRLRECQTN